MIEMIRTNFGFVYFLSFRGAFAILGKWGSGNKIPKSLPIIAKNKQKFAKLFLLESIYETF